MRRELPMYPRFAAEGKGFVRAHGACIEDALWGAALPDRPESRLPSQLDDASDHG